MKILVTGASGQLGRALQERGGGRVAWLPFTHQALDITSFDAIQKILAELKPDAVVNAAAYNAVDKAETDRAGAMAVNKTGPENLAKASAAQKIPIVHVSTDYVFDGKKGSPYVESDKPHPLSVYAESKRAGEEAVLKENPLSYVVRTAWVFHQDGTNFLLAILANKDKPMLKIVDDQFGSPTYAPHLAEKILQLLTKKAPYGFYHLAGAGGVSRFEFARAFFNLMNVKTPLTPIPTKEYPSPAVRPASSLLATERGKEWHLPPWEQGLKEFVKRITS